MEGAGFSAVEALGQVVSVEEVEIAYLGAVDTDDAKEPSGSNFKYLSGSRCDDHLRDEFE